MIKCGYVSYLQTAGSDMDLSVNPGEAPPGYSESTSTSSVPYGQSRLLHSDENTGPPSKIHQDQRGPNGPASSAPYPVPGGPAPYPGPPGYEPYGAPAYGYPMGPGYPPPGYGGVPPPAMPQQQQQQSVVVVSGQRERGPILISHVQSYAGHVIMACFVTWCCCPIFGIIAFILAGTSSLHGVAQKLSSMITHNRRGRYDTIRYGRLT